MNALLNIGMCRNNSDAMLTAKHIHCALDEFNVTEVKHRLAVSEPGTEEEDTYIVHVFGWSRDKAHAIAKRLDQDCIASYDLDECEGALIGPHADKWGAFNARFFKLL